MINYSKNYFLIFCVIALIIFSFFYLEINLEQILKTENWKNIFNLLKEFSEPNLNKEFLNKIYFAIFETFSMSIVSIFFSFSFSILILIISEFKFYILTWLIKIFLNFLRSIPDLVWALLLLVTFGLGPLTGTIALFLHTSGVLGKLFLETYENMRNENMKSLLIAGNNPVKIFFYSTLPLIFSQLLNFTLYRWENNIRTASILGIVGAGGLGQLLYFHLSLFHHKEVSTIIICIMLMVFCVDHISFILRRYLTGR